jgi:hypothetical protein
MEGSNAKASSAAADKYHGVTPEEVKKTRSKNPLKWFQRGGSKCASSSSASTPKQGAGVAENETKSRQPAAPIQRRVLRLSSITSPLACLYLEGESTFSVHNLHPKPWHFWTGIAKTIIELRHPPGGGANAILARALVHRILPFPLIGNRQSPDSADSCKSLRDEP